MFAFRRTRKFLRTVLLVALALYLLAHLLIRTDWIGGLVLRTISERTGYEASASRIRLTAALALSFTDFDLSYRDGAATNVVFSAPHLRFGWCCRRSAEAVRAQVFVRRTAGGTTVPSQFRVPAGATVPPDDLPRAVSPQFGDLLFRLTDSTVTVCGEGEDVVYDGLDWVREPVRLEGHPGAVQNVLTVQAVRPAQAEGGSFAPHELRDEWFELEGRSVRFATRSDAGAETAEPPAVESPAEPAAVEASPSEPPAAVESPAEPAAPAAGESSPSEPPAAVESQAETAEPAAGETSPSEPPAAVESHEEPAEAPNPETSDAPSAE